MSSAIRPVAQAVCLAIVAVFSFLLFKFQVFGDRP